MIFVKLCLSANLLRGGTWEVTFHVRLEVEVGKFFAGFDTKKFAKLGIGKDAATVFGILEFVFADVSVDFASDFSASHKGIFGFTKEGGELGADVGGFYETTGLAVTGFFGTAFAGFLGSAKFAVNTLLKGADTAGKLSHASSHGGEFGKKTSEFFVKRNGFGFSFSCGSFNNSGSNFNNGFSNNRFRFDSFGSSFARFSGGGFGSGGFARGHIIIL
jgi:hypothetical protein